ncbi:MAG: hypothetical protein RLZZ29_816 [Cyanobacteriota bacterium]|uniref:Uncharacterized protein n=1 Tax=Anabaena sphaerica FACHB-251 TaxID=2692883 RepID=A0A926WNF7_9NOST|nr:hypothetical protein [Anabaena sphaerica]MBD2296984.1 hypothetical protein [Anabaena sphaerica FACHB-251]MBD2297004.1 hypothetical protein [Anabaena sphaerica FACHB-251]
MKIARTPILMAKKDDPNYKKLSGHIPKELFTDFKKILIDKGLDISTALEIIVGEWVEANKKD